jgi:hypothetical protein
VPLSVPDALHVLQENFLSAAIVELGGPAVGMTGDTLSGFKGTVILQKIRDASCPEWADFQIRQKRLLDN